MAFGRWAWCSGSRAWYDGVFAFYHGPGADLWREFFYNNSGEMKEVFNLAPGSDCVALNTPLGQRHTVEVLESGTVILECKDGAMSRWGRRIS